MLKTNNVSWVSGRLKYCVQADGELAFAQGYYANGNHNFFYPMKNGQFHGVCKIWWESGVLQQEEEFINGVLDGKLKKWYEDGQLEMLQHYTRGLLHGIEKRWDLMGRLIVARMLFRGIEAPKNLSDLIINNKLHAKHILEIPNVQLRRQCLEYFGYERFLAQMPHEILAKEADQELVKILWYKREEPIVLVKVKCPSTGAFYTLRVPPAMRSVRQAIAWTFGLEEADYYPEKES